MGIQLNLVTESRGIEWSDETNNVAGGCLHRCVWQMPDGSLAYCYACACAEHGVAKSAYSEGFEHHYFRESQLKTLKAGSEPRLKFIDSMSDLFGEWVPTHDFERIMHAMQSGPHHTFQSLTKSPGRLMKFAHMFPSNLFIGVSSPPDFMMPADEASVDSVFEGTDIKPAKRLSERQKVAMLRKTIKCLQDVKRETGNVVWMSLEPVSWDIAAEVPTDHALDWVVIGAATNGKKNYQPNPVHIRKLLDLFDATNTPVFFKGNIQPLFDNHDFGCERHNRWREDFPVVYRDGSLIPAVLRRQEMARQHGWALNTHLLEWHRRNPEVDLDWKKAMLTTSRGVAMKLNGKSLSKAQVQ